MAWLDNDWHKRKKITLTGGTSGAQTDFQLKLEVTHDSDMKADFSDLRFTQSDGTTLIDAWLESKTDSTTADIWIEFPTTPANTVTEDYYMYYDNSGASAAWNIGNTFIFGDDFNGLTNGDLNGQNSWSGSTLFDVQATTTYEGAKAVEMNGVAAATYTISRSITATGDGRAIIYMRKNGSHGKQHVEFLESGTIKQGVYLGSSGYIFWYVPGTGWYDFGNYSMNVWVKVIMEWRTTDDMWRVSINDGAFQSWTGGTGTFTSIDSIQLKSYNTDNGALYWDTVSVGEYAANPATYVFGAEESGGFVTETPVNPAFTSTGTIPILFFSAAERFIIDTWMNIRRPRRN